MKTTSLFIYALTRTIFEGKVNGVTVPSEDGELTILPMHAPTVSALKTGKIYTLTDDGGHEFFIKKGFVYADQNSIVCLVTEN